ncbi:hemolysin secretion protein D [Acuticoccus sediminis]|uniref:Hemolysin secretion protein D n=1 Tax=Acuticoccus sediminis TaxID=2184697 RepID=A0A8B2NM03_9HYPH|nr:HlyD family secretion protein [Acuticoccus sediminis]RAH97394.1 hemolysin secretion protein D [Acuticoccus sediminis]
MLARATRHIATLFAVALGIAGVVAVLYAWKLPPFTSTMKVTEDAYVRGRVTTLAPQLAGQIAEVAVTDFQPVHAGDVLVRIDDDIYRQRLAQAEATLAERRAALAGNKQDRIVAEAKIRSADAGVASAEATLKVAEANLGRIDKLQSRGVATKREADEQGLARDQARATRDQAKAEADQARQNLAAIATNRRSLEAEVANAQASVRLAQIDLDNTVITAPVNGRLGEVSARVGQYVTSGTRLTTLVAEDIWVVANFKETQVGGMTPGLPVSFTVDALGDAELSGTIERFSPATGSEFSVLSSSNATGNFIKVAQRLPVRIAIDPGQPLAERLAPGMSVVARVDTAHPARSDVAGSAPRTVAAADAPLPNP